MNILRFINLRNGLVPLLCGTLLACAIAPKELTIDPIEWVYEEGAITIEIESPADLNTLSGRPHSLTIGIFQLSDPNTFSGLTETKQGIIELLNKGRIDDTVVNFKRETLQPGEHKRFLMSRAEKAQYVGLIIGYFNLTTTHDVKLFPIPIKASSRGLVEATLSTMQLIASEAKSHPDRLMVYINLGRSNTKQIRLIEPNISRKAY